jgi:hypothetical protein
MKSDNVHYIDYKRFKIRIYKNINNILYFFIFVFLLYYILYYFRSKQYNNEVIIYIENHDNSNLFFTSNLIYHNAYNINKINILKAILTSKRHNIKVINKLGLSTTYYKKSHFKYNEIYDKEVPFYVEYDQDHIQLAEYIFNIKFINNKYFIIQNINNAHIGFLYDMKQDKIISKNYKKYIIFNKKFNYNVWVCSPFFKFKIIKKSNFINNNYFFKLNIKNKIVTHYIKKLKINNQRNLEDYYINSALIKLSMKDNNKYKVIDYLNTSIKVLINNESIKNDILYDHYINSVLNLFFFLKKKIFFLTKNKSINYINYHNNYYLTKNNFMKKYHKIYNDYDDCDLIMYSTQYKALFNKLIQLILIKKINSSDIHIIDFAKDEVKNYFIDINFLYEHIILVLIIILISFIVLLIQEIFDDKFIVINDLFSNTNFSCLGCINLYNTNTKYQLNNLSKLSNFIFIRENIKLDNSKFIRANKSVVLIITSYTSKEGKSFISSYLAKSFALNSKTILLDCNLIHPMIHRMFKIQNKIGLIDYLYNDHYCNYNRFIVKSIFHNNLDLMLTGDIYKITSSIETLLYSILFKKLIFLLKKDYKYIILDTSSYNNLFNNFNLVDICDLIIYIIRCNFSYKEYITHINDFFIKYNVKKIRFLINQHNNYFL